MEFKKGIEGTLVMITEEAGWVNFGEVRESLPAGTVLRLESWRPEGYNAIIPETGEHFFLFKKYIESGYEVKGGSESFIRTLNRLIEDAKELGAFIQLLETSQMVGGRFYDEMSKDIADSRRVLEETRQELLDIYEKDKHND